MCEETYASWLKSSKSLTKKDSRFIINFSSRVTKPQRPPGTLHSEVSRNINLPLPARPPRVHAVNNRQSSGLYGPAVLCFAFKTVIGIFGRSVKLLTARDAPHQTNSSDGNKAVRKRAESGCNHIKSWKLLEKSRKAQTHSQKIDWPQLFIRTESKTKRGSFI